MYILHVSLDADKCSLATKVPIASNSNAAAAREAREAHGELLGVHLQLGALRLRLVEPLLRALALLLNRQLLAHELCVQQRLLVAHERELLLVLVQPGVQLRALLLLQLQLLIHDKFEYVNHSLERMQTQPTAYTSMYLLMRMTLYSLLGNSYSHSYSTTSEQPTEPAARAPGAR